tara:strand:+ start:7514 stop:7972 length:459 start_codon:yes stop_codon:yes gene_type:complete
MDEKQLEALRKRLGLNSNMYTNSVDGDSWTSFVPEDSGLSYWTDQIDDFTTSIKKDTDEYGWSNKNVEVVTIWELTGQNPGKELGKEVFNASLEHGVKSGKKTQSGSEIGYRCYPKAWLEMWFRDYDAKLSMEVYNKARAKEALNQINNKNK